MKTTFRIVLSSNQNIHKLWPMEFIFKFSAKICQNMREATLLKTQEIDTKTLMSDQNFFS